jgi:phage tail-like protein
MTQTPHRSIAAKRTQISIQIPDHREWYSKTPEITHQNKRLLPGYQNTEESSQALLLTPGEMREIWVQVENGSEEALESSVVIRGDFPKEWYTYNSENSYIIPANEKSRLSLTFQVAKDFFENENALDTQQSLKLNYEGEIYIYLGGRTEPVRYQHFYIFVRPKSSYLSLLPEIYHRSDFINRLLMIFEQGFDPSRQNLDHLWAYLNPLTAPKAFLPFLAKWVAWEMNPRWDDKQQRRLIKNAVELYRWRGSKRGLRLYIHLFTGLPLDEDLPEVEKSICIEECFDTGFVLGKANFNSHPRLGGGKPFYFRVTLHVEDGSQVDENLVREVIEEAKPAFCSYDLYIVNC